MSEGVAFAVFVSCLLLAATSGAVLSHRLDQVGTRLGFSEALLGLLTALAADSPEIATAVSAIVSGRHELGAGVIFGSNIFNLAILFGLSAAIAGRIACGRRTVLLNAGVAAWVTGVAAWQLLTGAPPWAAGALIAAVLLPYLAVSALRPSRLRVPLLPASVLGWLRETAREAEADAGDEPRPAPPTWADWLSIPPLLATVVGASYGLTRAATTLGTQFGVGDAVMGTLVLATLTGIPNAVAAVRLAAAGRGNAVVSETFNSNTLNLLVGAYLPTLFSAAPPVSAFGRLTLFILLGTTALAALLLLRKGGLVRWEGLALLAGYAGFAALVIAR